MAGECNTLVIKLGVWGPFLFWFICFFSTSIETISWVHEIIKYMAAVSQIPWRKCSQPWAKKLHLPSNILSSAPLTFSSKISGHHYKKNKKKKTNKQTNKTIFLNPHKWVHYLTTPHKVNWCSGCRQVPQNSLPPTKDQAKMLQLEFGDRAAFLTQVTQQWRR